MSSIYEHLSKVENAKPEREEVFLPPEPELPSEEKFQPEMRKPPRFIGIKITAALAILVSLFSLAGVAYLFMQSRQPSATEREMAAQYGELMRASEAWGARTAEYRQTMEQLRARLERLTAERTAIQKEINRNRIEVSNLEKRMIQVEDRSRAMEETLENLAGGGTVGGGESRETPAAEDPPASSMSEPANSALEAPAPAAPASPQVMTVNRKFDFVVVNIGLRDNVKIGDRLEIMHAGKSVGTAEVEKLYDSFSAATIVEERTNAQIQEGDTVRKL